MYEGYTVQFTLQLISYKAKGGELGELAQTRRDFTCRTSSHYDVSIALNIKQHQ